jgi:hypothetical protein
MPGTMAFSQSSIDSVRIAKRDSDISFYLFVGGAIVGLLQLFYPFGAGPTHKIEFGDGFEMVAIANNLAQHGAFANPFWVGNTGPTAAVPPLYPFLLSVPTRILKRPEFIMIVAVIANIVVNSLIAAWLPRLSLLFFGQAVAGAIGGLLWLAAMRLMPSWDASYTVFGLIAFCLLSASWIERKKYITGFGAAAGMIAGLLTLMNPASVMITLPWVAYLLVQRRVGTKRAAEYYCALIAALFLIVSGWAARNHHELGAYVLRTNLGMTLYASNNDCAKSSLVEDMRSGCYETHHPNTSAAEASLLRTLGEVEYDRLRVADARIWVAANPHRFWQLTLKRFVEFWFPAPGEPAYTTYAIWLVTALALPGLILMAWRREPVTWFVITVLLIYPLMYYVVVSDVRYRYPVLWLSLLPAGYFAAWMTARVTSRVRVFRQL